MPAGRARRADPASAGDGPGAVVIGSDYGGLGIVRSLGRRGIPVWVLRDEGHASAAVSRYARRSLPWPAGDAARLDLLLDLADRRGLRGWALYPTHDEAAALVARHAGELAPHFLLTTPPWEVTRWAYDKRLTYALAGRLGVGHPRTLCLRGPADLAAPFPFPAILKPAVKDRPNRFTRARAWPVRDRDELLRRYEEAQALVDPATIMLQELVPGGGEAQLSFAALCRDGRPLAFAVARRTRQYPADFGHGSTFVETVDEPAVEAPARRLLAELRYTGLVELEFKRDPRTGRLLLLDINARAWGWHTLGARAGVDFAWLSWRLVRGLDVEETRATPGYRWIRGTTDIPAAFAAWRRGSLPFGAYLRSLRPPLEHAVLALDDPLPGLLDPPALAFRACCRWREG